MHESNNEIQRHLDALQRTHRNSIVLSLAIGGALGALLAMFIAM